MATHATAGPWPATKFYALVDAVLSQIQRDPTFQPDALLWFNMGGAAVAAALNEVLRIDSRYCLGLPVIKAAGVYTINEVAVNLEYFARRHVLLVDDSSNRGLLTRDVARMLLVRFKVASVRSCVLIANQAGIQPHYVGETYPGSPPKFSLRPRP